ncbi:PREDICTED: protein pxr-1 [Camelina sativa]|uniref:Protein pxr-1 n=1 Tax=Camelina sativa TaxID=90675 RepID=A0ABM0YZN4_CAMSA|nr:PREDICTED: protein pxr-1 [Camelina sativa]XP_010508376.1 PREDICTED: protein pxr-1 [Camelina sativa]
MDGSFHTPEWHAARLASLKTTQTITWEEYKKKQKEEELKKGEHEADTDKLMREYRAQLDAERAMKLSKGRNYSTDQSTKDKKERDLTDRKERDSKRKRSKKRKHSRRRSSDSSSSSESSSSDEEESRKSRSSSKRSKRERKHKSRGIHSKPK